MLLGISAVLSVRERRSICVSLGWIGGKWREICTPNANICLKADVMMKELLWKQMEPQMEAVLYQLNERLLYFYLM